MRLPWIVKRNPYRNSYYGVLGLGAKANRQRIVKRGTELTKKLRSGAEIRHDDRVLTVHEIQEAQSRLGDLEIRAAELLLVHPSVEQQKSRSQELKKELVEATEIASKPLPLELPGPEAVFFFVPDPATEMIPAPAFEALGLVEAGDAADKQLDIVFDE